MAILRNDEADPQLEAMLHAFISSEALQCIRAFIPPTYWVDKSKRPEYWQASCADGNFVLKESISSGMKGTIFSSDARFSAALAKAVKARGRAVLQREVQNRARRFEYFTDTGACQSAEWFTRVTVHFAGREVADIVVTARQDRSVHGATDCLQLGAVITS